jgi:predicted Ser/Thr protein kinase
METIKICPNCRKPLPPDVPLGLCPECLIKSGFPTEGGGGVSGEAAGARFVPPPVEEIARLFPQLEILGLIGKGGMGAVYKARQPALDRFVALKVLPPAVASDPGFAERFNREARALARLNHPNIVAVHDFGKTGPLHYLIMEFVDGTNLREVEHAGRLSPEQALAIVPQICEALQFAHNEGIVHRDIKPENLLLDKRGRVKITDFGIAKIVGAAPGKISLTGVKDVVGTPHYMAPEQIEKPQEVDHRADIYSLGVVFYEMLTGELPLGKFAPPSKKVQIDVRLDEVVMHTLEKEPERRYQQVNQLKSDVETIAGTPPPMAGFAAKGGTVPPAVVSPAKMTSDKILLPTLLLAFPFGIFGAHRFYVGKIGTAFLQLGAFVACILLTIACATLGRHGEPVTGILLGVVFFGCVIWAMIDWILIVCKGFTDGQGKRMIHWLHPQNGVSSMPGSPAGLRPGGGAPAAGTGIIVAPAVGLMVAALWKLLSAMTALTFLNVSNPWQEQMLKMFGIGSISGMASVSLVLFKVIPGLLIMFGAFQMLRLRSYPWSVAAGILAILSCSLISLPFGVWALVVLARPDVRETFARQHELPPTSKKFWPWAVGIALIGVAIVIAMFVINGLITSVALMHHRQTGGMPEVTGVNTAITSVVPGNASVPNRGSTNGIVMPTPATVPPPVRIKAGSSESFTDSDGNLWLPDQGFVGGNTVERSPDLAIVNTRDPELYRSERYDMRSFSYPVPNGKYIVKLHFAESNGHIAGPGNRVFTFVVGSQEFKDFDVWTEAGGVQRALIKTVNVEVTDDRLNIYFIRQQEHPEINGIEILPVPSAADAVTPALPKPTNIPATAQSQPAAHPEKVIGNLSTSDPFQQDYHQTLPLSANGRLRLDNVNGQTEIVGWNRNEVSIKALKHGKTQESIETTKIVVDSAPDEISIHTKQPDSQSGFLRLLSWLINGGTKNVTVDYAIQVPRNTCLKEIASVNGQVVIEDVSSDINVSTVNGALQVAGAEGDLKLSTVNGRITAELVSLDRGQSVSLNSVNGRIEVFLPADANAEVKADTVNGSITSDFSSLMVKKEFPVNENLKGTLGNGGASVKASTVNGKISVRRGEDAQTPGTNQTEREDDGQTVAGLPPVVVETWPVSGMRDVEPGVAEIRVRFSKEMADGSWSWSTAWENSTPEFIGPPRYESDGRTCTVKVKLEPGRTYGWWLNSDKFRNFTDQAGRPAVPYLLIFQTKQN